MSREKVTFSFEKKKNGKKKKSTQKRETILQTEQLR
jgi:hypothetical protein